MLAGSSTAGGGCGSIRLPCLARPVAPNLAASRVSRQGLAMVESAGFGGEGAIRQRALAPSRLEALLFWSLIVLLAAMPLPFGSARPWAWSLAAVIVALLLLLHALWTAGSGGPSFGGST